MILKETLRVLSKQLLLKKITGSHLRQYVRKAKENPFATKYSQNDQERILSVLNALGDSTSPAMKITKAQHTSIKKHLSENERFKNLDDVLNLKGFGHTSLETLCNRILEGSNSPDDNNASTVFKLKSNNIVPAISELQKQKIKSVVGLQIDNFYISWVRFDCETNTVTNWELIELINAADAKNLISIYQFVISLREKIPFTDIYVLESVNWNNHNSQTSLHSHMRAAQTAAMLVPVLNGQVDNRSLGDEETSVLNCNKVHFLKAFLHTRFFKTLIGSEKVSPQKMIEEMLEGNFPGFFSSFSFKNECKDYYLSNVRPSRESLCQSLLLTLTFIEVILLNKVDLRKRNMSKNN